MSNAASRLATLVLAIASTTACTCGAGGASGAGKGGAGEGSGSATGAAPSACVNVRPQVEALYRAEVTAGGATPDRVAEAVRDNTAMVMAECTERPTLAACAARARTAQQLEAECLQPLSDEGTEGATISR
jgi:hypothetical protein